jgi:nitrate reductase (cytochrome), electron transfer subunit
VSDDEDRPRGAVNGRDPPSSRRSLLPPPSAPLFESKRLVHVLGAVGIMLATVGYFSGIAAERREPVARPSAEATASAPAPGYPQLRAERRGPNAAIYAGAFERLGDALPAISAELPPQTDDDRAAVLASRAALRAYDGAPPTIPHAVEGSSTFECLACHAKGAVVGGKRAAAMSHERHDSCTQCHVSAGGPPVAAPAPLASNAFVGERSPAGGERAWPGAPPTIPHSTQMRAACGSCHGAAGALGMRSTHPWRESCTQCHAPAARLDQRASHLATIPSPPDETKKP